MPDYSKAARGLFVLVCVGRVFTAIAISPSEFSRQLSARYAFRAGLNFICLKIAYALVFTSGALPELYVATEIGLYLPPNIASLEATWGLTYSL